MLKIRVVQVEKKGGPFDLVERDLPNLGPGEVRVKVQACGVCHSDSIAKQGLFPSVPYPIVPGHEIAGVIDAVGDGVIGWAAGTRVGVGWFGGHCGRCEPCRRGYLVDCRNLRIPGINYDGGYAEAMVAPADAPALIHRRRRSCAGAMVVEHVAPRPRVRRQDVLQNLAHGAASGFGLRAGEVALDVGRKDDPSHFGAPCAGTIARQLRWMWLGSIQMISQIWPSRSLKLRPYMKP
jgi:NADPH:quinone reductase-like Zn-dependent oxidoreductase